MQPFVWLLSFSVMCLGLFMFYYVSVCHFFYGISIFYCIGMMQIIYSFIYWWILRLFVHPCDDGQGLMPNGPDWIPVCTTSYPPGHLYICKSTTKAEHASKSWGFCSKSLWLCIGPEKSLRTRKGNYFCWDLTLSPIAVWLLVHLCWAHPPNINSRELWVLSSPDN